MEKVTNVIDFLTENGGVKSKVRDALAQAVLKKMIKVLVPNGMAVAKATKGNTLVFELGVDARTRQTVFARIDVVITTTDPNAEKVKKAKDKTETPLDIPNLFED